MSCTPVPDFRNVIGFFYIALFSGSVSSVVGDLLRTVCLALVTDLFLVKCISV